MLKVQNLSKKIDGKTILSGISFEIGQGEIGVFLGHSGAGKTTLLRILNNLETYDTGSFFLQGAPISLTEVNKNHTIGIVFQNFNLFENLTVEENITLVLRKTQAKDLATAKSAAHTLLKHYELADKAHARIQQLSGGQKQRLAIARADCVQPKIICLDEPTSALDPRLTRQLMGTIGSLAQDNRIVLITTHNVNVPKLLNAKIFFMQHGQIAESSSSQEFYKDPKKFPLINQYLSGDHHSD